MKKWFKSKFIIGATILLTLGIFSNFVYPGGNILSTKAMETLELLLTPDGNIGAIPMSDVTPSDTTARLYNTGGSLYWSGNSLISSGGSPSFATVDLTGITDGNIPNMAFAAAGFEDSPLSTDGTNVDVSGGRVTSVGNPVEPTDAANLQSVLEQTGVSLHYYFGNTTLDQELTESEAAIQELQDADPDLFSNIFFVALEADTPAPFTVDTGAIIPVHFSAKVTTGPPSKYDTVLYVKLGYVNSDGSVGSFVQIGANSDSTAILTTAQTSYELHIHVATEITVPVTKRLYLQVWADSSGTGGYDTIHFYYDSVAHHVQFAIDASVLENFVQKAGDTMTGNLVTVGMDAKNGTTSAGSVDFFEDGDNGSNYVQLIGPASTTDVVQTLQAATGTVLITGTAVGRDFQALPFANAGTNTEFTIANMLLYKGFNNGEAGEETDIYLDNPAYFIQIVFTVAEAFVSEICPPSGELFLHDGTALDANDCIDTSAVVGDAIAFTRTIAAGTHRWTIYTIQGVHVDTGASD